jgi:hypothetical protein
MVSKMPGRPMGRFGRPMGRFGRPMGRFLLTAGSITLHSFEAFFCNFFLLTQLLTIYPIGC